MNISGRARSDLDSIFDYIAAEGDVEAVSRFIAGLAIHLERIAAAGHSGVPRDTIKPGLRLAVHGRYNIYFRVSEDETVIVRVLHSARDIRRLGFQDEP